MSEYQDWKVTFPTAVLLIGKLHTALELIRSGRLGPVVVLGRARFVQVTAIEQYLGRKLTPRQIGFVNSQTTLRNDVLHLSAQKRETAPDRPEAI